MAWISPVTNWTDSSTLAYTDHNRIEGNNDHLRNSFELSGSLEYDPTVTGEQMVMQVPVSVLDGQTLRLIEARYNIDEYSTSEVKLKVQFGTSTAWESADEYGDDSPAHVLHTASGSNDTEYLKIIVNVVSVGFGETEDFRQAYVCIKMEIDL